MFPGIKKKLDKRYIEEKNGKKDLLKNIIQGKQNVKAFREFIDMRKKKSQSV